jgi:hypothetical protein
MEVKFFHGYKGLPPESSDVPNCVMSERMADAIKSARVDNIDFYPVVLTHKKSGKTYRYFAYNIIGLLSAVDMEASDLTFYDKRVFGHASIHNLVLDENKINDLLIFRLKEQSSTVIVHERVKQALEKAGIDRVNFIKPENYIHL